MRQLSTLCALSVLTLGACSTARGDIDAFFLGLAPLPADEPERVAGAKSAEAREGDFSCTTQDFHETRRFDEVVAFSANSDSLFPGAILRGDSVYSGLFTQAVFPRNPLKFSVSLESIAGAPSATMQSPALSEYREELNGILA